MISSGGNIVVVFNQNQTSLTGLLKSSFIFADIISLSVTVDLPSREPSEMLHDYIHHDSPVHPEELLRARAHHYFTKCFSHSRLSAL